MRVGSTDRDHMLAAPWVQVFRLHDRLYRALYVRKSPRLVKKYAEDLRTALRNVGSPRALLVRLSRACLYHADGDIPSAIREAEGVMRTILRFFSKTPTGTAAAYFLMAEFFDDRLYGRLARLYLLQKRPASARRVLMKARYFCIQYGIEFECSKLLEDVEDML